MGSVSMSGALHVAFNGFDARVTPVQYTTTPGLAALSAKMGHHAAGEI